MPAQEVFTSGQAARYTGVPYKTLDFWAKSGFIAPSVLQSSGKGTDRIYSFRDLVALRTASRLREAGISLQKLRRVIRYLQGREGLESPLAETFLASDGQDVFELHGEIPTSILRRPGQTAFAWVLDLSDVVAELQKRIAA